MTKTTTYELNANEIAALVSKVNAGHALTATESRNVLMTARLTNTVNVASIEVLLDAIEAAA